MARAFLRIESGPMSGRVVPLEGPLLEIGREPGSGLLLEGYSQVSRRHARIEWDGQQFSLTDLGSTNGVFVNGQRVQRSGLAEGSWIQLGDCQARFAYQEPKAQVPGAWRERGRDLFQKAAKRVAALPGTKVQKSVIAGVAGVVLLLLMVGMVGGRRQQVLPPPANVPGPEAQAPVDNGPQGTAPSLNPVDGKIDPKALENAKVATVLIAHPDGGGTAMGSGFVLGNPRQIITNRHVVVDKRGNTADLTLIFEAGTPRQRRIDVSADHVTLAAPTGNDFEDDLALIKLDGDQVPALPAGESNSLTETDKVYAIGFPLGVSTLTVDGAIPSVSVKTNEVERLQRDSAGTVSVIQLGGTVTYGNSGGPVVNKRGEVVGVISRKAVDTSMAFAIPMQFVRRLTGG